MIDKQTDILLLIMDQGSKLLMFLFQTSQVPLINLSVEPILLLYYVVSYDANNLQVVCLLKSFCHSFQISIEILLMK